MCHKIKKKNNENSIDLDKKYNHIYFSEQGPGRTESCYQDALAPSFTVDALNTLSEKKLDKIIEVLIPQLFRSDPARVFSVVPFFEKLGLTSEEIANIEVELIAAYRAKGGDDMTDNDFLKECLRRAFRHNELCLSPITLQKLEDARKSMKFHHVIINALTCPYLK